MLEKTKKNNFSKNEDGEQWVTISDMNLIRDYFSADPDTLDELNEDEILDIMLYHDTKGATYEFRSSNRAIEDNYDGVCEWLIEKRLHKENKL